MRARACGGGSLQQIDKYLLGTAKTMECIESLQAYLAEKDVEFVPSVEIREVTRDSESNFDVMFHDGSVVKNASAVWAVYPQTAPRFVKDAGLANAAGFVPADIGTNRVATDAARKAPGSVFCVGDCAACPENEGCEMVGCAWADRWGWCGSDSQYLHLNFSR